MTEDDTADTIATWQPNYKEHEVSFKAELVQGKLFNSRDLIGVIINGQYFLRRRVNQGNLGDVYEAWDQQRSTLVAVKVMRAELALKRIPYFYFKNEFDVLSALSHPNIIKVFDFGHYEGVVFMVLEWIQGLSLNDKLKELKKPMNTSEVGAILKPLCAALSYIHRMGWVHCDIKPSNILLREGSNDVVLMDFGIAKSIGQENFVSGTMAYMAPEQFEISQIGIEVDIYNLGVTVFELLSGGNYPFKPESSGSAAYMLAHLHSSPYPLNQFNPSIQANIVLLLHKSLARNPAHRFNSASEFWNAYSRAALSGYSGHRDKSSSIAIIFPKKISTRKNTNIDVIVYFAHLHKKIKRDLEGVYEPDDLNLLLGAKFRHTGTLEVRMISQNLQFSKSQNVTTGNIKRLKFTLMANKSTTLQKHRVTIEIIHPAEKTVLLSEAFELVMSDHFLDRFFTPKLSSFTA